jgi:hypothetical protein
MALSMSLEGPHTCPHCGCFLVPKLAQGGMAPGHYYLWVSLCSLIITSSPSERDHNVRPVKSTTTPSPTITQRILPQHPRQQSLSPASSHHGSSWLCVHSLAVQECRTAAVSTSCVNCIAWTTRVDAQHRLIVLTSSCNTNKRNARQLNLMELCLYLTYPSRPFYYRTAILHCCHHLSLHMNSTCLGHFLWMMLSRTL